ncbi:HalOD1 output domain-containing protein [Haloprofundus salilacus]|uniref:HalOD1 output domain-containing protein n=1 Tax=Haloprofundus salilacus TaxID=2876190 RepID=UPI001CCD789C|nr:HalOD1 output domain-containing protein [Haloprofundus salilacus]
MASEEQEYQFIDGSSLSVNIVKAIAEFRDVEKHDIGPPLYEAIDTTALDRISESVEEPAIIEFEYNGLKIVAQTDGKISIMERKVEI